MERKPYEKPEVQESREWGSGEEVEGVETDVTKWRNVSGVPIFPGGTVINPTEEQWRRVGGGGTALNPDFTQGMGGTASSSGYLGGGGTVGGGFASTSGFVGGVGGSCSGLPADGGAGGGVRSEGSVEGYSEEMLRGISVDDGKYLFQLRNGDYRIFVRRYGDEWLAIAQGGKAILAMMFELDEARAKVKELQEEVEGLKEEKIELRDKLGDLEEQF